MIYFQSKDGTWLGWDAALEAAPGDRVELSREEYEPLLQKEQAQAEAEEQARREEAEAMPTPVEQMRADIDYLAALQGVSL